MSKEQQIESTDWLTRGISKEQLEREKQEAVMSADLAMCHTEFTTGVGEIYTDYDTTAQKMYAIGYRKQYECEWVGNCNGTFTCTVCGGRASKMNYCGHCGAKMKGGNN
jgi:hypothetical protein